MGGVFTAFLCQKKDLGFNKNQVMTVIVNTGEDERGKINAMDNDFRSLPGVKRLAPVILIPEVPILT